MITSYSDFSNGLADLVVTGVATRKRHLPNQLPTAQLPLSFPRLPEGREMPLTADGQGGWPQMVCELVVVVEPSRQNRAEQNHELTLQLIDALSLALRGVEPGTICKSKLNWTIRSRQDVLGETEYWLLVATVTGSG